MSALSGLLPIVRKAWDTLEQFTGDAAEASRSSVITDAIEVISAVTPLIEDFGRGTEITPEDVRGALMDMDTALADFDAEIAKQDQEQGGG